MPRLTISDAQLARMRAQVPLPDTGVIQAMTATPDNAGGWTESWAAVTGGTVLCRLDPITSRSDNIQTAQAREGLRGDWQLTTEYDAPLAVNRRIVINSKTYEVVQMSDVHSWNVSRRALVARID